ADRVLDGRDAALEELVVVLGQRIHPEAVRRVAVRHLVEVRVGGPEAREELEALGAISAFFPELTLRRDERVLAGERAPARELPRHRARQVPVLADEQDVGVVHERQHADGHAAGQGVPPRRLDQAGPLRPDAGRRDSPLAGARSGPPGPAPPPAHAAAPRRARQALRRAREGPRLQHVRREGARADPVRGRRGSVLLQRRVRSPRRQPLTSASRRRPRLTPTPGVTRTPCPTPPSSPRASSSAARRRRSSACDAGSCASSPSAPATGSSKWAAARASSSATSPRWSAGAGASSAWTRAG